MNIVVDFVAKTAVLFILAVLPLTSGCSHRHATTVSTTEVRDEPRASYSASEGQKVTKTETKTVSEDKDSHHGHGIFAIIGDIIALPFRAVGALFTAIF